MNTIANISHHLCARFALAVLFLRAVLGGFAAEPPVCLNNAEVRLAQMINDYRVNNGKAPIALSHSLTAVAQWHIRNMLYAVDVSGKFGADPICNLHSWYPMPDTTFTTCCYTSDHAQAACMWNKPAEITSSVYTGNGYEIAAAGYPDVAAALAGWKSSPGHNAVILSQGAWSEITFRAMGVGADETRRFYFVWFGSQLDPNGTPIPCPTVPTPISPPTQPPTSVTPPTITLQPKTQTVIAGVNVTFSVAADGTAPLSYEWRFNGAPIPGTRSATLTLNNVQESDSGRYTVLITNHAGEVVSNPAVLTVLAKVSLLEPPVISHAQALGQEKLTQEQIAAIELFKVAILWRIAAPSPLTQKEREVISRIMLMEAHLYGFTDRETEAIFGMLISANRLVQVGKANGSAGDQVTLPIELVGTGVENTWMFSVIFNPSHLVLVSLDQGSSVVPATLQIDNSGVAKGIVGVTVTAPANSAFPAGTNVTLWLNLRVSSSVTNTTELPISFGDTPVIRRTLPSNGNELFTKFLDGSVNIKVAAPKRTAPMISKINDQVTTQGVRTAVIHFSIEDAETRAEDLTVSGSSSDVRVIKNEDIVLGGFGLNRTVVLVPKPKEVGNATITLTVTDEHSQTASTSFIFTVNPAPLVTAPQISKIPDQSMVVGSVVQVAFMANDPDGPVSSLSFVGHSSNENLVRSSHILFGGNDNNRIVVIVPIQNAVGTARITITVTYGTGLSSVTQFSIMVTAPSLKVKSSGGDVELTWPGSVSGFVLEVAESLLSSDWRPVVFPVRVVNGNRSVNIPMTKRNGFYRLRQE